VVIKNTKKGNKISAVFHQILSGFAFRKNYVVVKKFKHIENFILELKRLNLIINFTLHENAKCLILKLATTIRSRPRYQFLATPGHKISWNIFNLAGQLFRSSQMETILMRGKVGFFSISRGYFKNKVFSFGGIPLFSVK
jgi:hypothetical protein